MGFSRSVRLNHSLATCGSGNAYDLLAALEAPACGHFQEKDYISYPLDWISFWPMPGGYGVMSDDGSIDYSVHEAWNEATNVYLVVILVSFGLFMYAKRNKRKIMRIFSVPPTAETLSEPNFYDTISKIRLRQQLEMYSISRKYDYQQPQNQADSVQLSLE
ncbi:small integral membrane protein 19 isoform X1 [Rousettus aegyptiacus]|uniref:Small integral membrane protein 19 n=2 Tax=Rousettus aegyptiacus TaxID=9407 RepID=A0A7J8DZK2_ROUAE|nr:small integral membrane protein 19 isoform X1 [Rousettus aegyptiacus]KAF6428485.1 small integral membrane protein 19 [Rousettus aegyptiacus]